MTALPADGQADPLSSVSCVISMYLHVHIHTTWLQDRGQRMSCPPRQIGNPHRTPVVRAQPRHTSGTRAAPVSTQRLCS
jgi:hypothetical protein